MQPPFDLWRLYDLGQGTGETVNLAAHEPGKLDEPPPRGNSYLEQTGGLLGPATGWRSPPNDPVDYFRGMGVRRGTRRRRRRRFTPVAAAGDRISHHSGIIDRSIP
jgi:hypothetical protein